MCIDKIFKIEPKLLKPKPQYWLIVLIAIFTVIYAMQLAKSV